jgi:PAP2 superfamily
VSGVSVMLKAIAVAWIFIAGVQPLTANALRAGDGSARARERLTGAIVAEWNQLAYDLAFAEDRFTTFKGQRALAMMHLAQHDALNAISPRYESYIGREESFAATQRRRDLEAVGNAQPDPIAAAARAARDVLCAQYPAARGEIEALFERQVAARAAPASARKRGLEAGRAAAQAILETRKGDGWDDPGAYEFRTGPGAYQTTPDWRGFVVHPGLAHAQPFFLKSAAQLRPPGPPPLASRAYARAFEEVKAYGAIDSAVRTPDQTHYAVWWMEFSESLVNRYVRRRVSSEGIELWRTARLFALLNAALVDAYVAVWDTKYVYNHWRPYTAIRAAQSDGNSRTTPDAAWQSLRPAPPFPEYVSAHAAGCATTFALLERELGADGEIELDSLAAPEEGPRQRTFSSFRAAAQECADSRVRLGFHFRYSTDAGHELGRRIAAYVARRHLTPLWRAQDQF